jgi:hypothetical protein
MQGLQQAHGFTTVKLRQQHAGSKASTARFALFTAPTIRGSRDAVSGKSDQYTRTVAAGILEREWIQAVLRPAHWTQDDGFAGALPVVFAGGVRSSRYRLQPARHGLAGPQSR